MLMLGGRLTVRPKIVFMYAAGLVIVALHEIKRTLLSAFIFERKANEERNTPYFQAQHISYAIVS